MFPVKAAMSPTHLRRGPSCGPTASIWRRNHSRSGARPHTRHRLTLPVFPTGIRGTSDWSADDEVALMWPRRAESLRQPRRDVADGSGGLSRQPAPRRPGRRRRCRGRVLVRVLGVGQVLLVLVAPFGLRHVEQPCVFWVTRSPRPGRSMPLAGPLVDAAGSRVTDCVGQKRVAQVDSGYCESAADE
jgi:hypothetical protein